MDKTQIRRHNLVFLNKEGKERIWQEISGSYAGLAQKLVAEVLLGEADVPGFVRRDDYLEATLPVGFVHYQRLEGNRLRIPAFAAASEVVTIMTPYEVMERKAYSYEAKNDCLRTVLKLYAVAEIFDLQVGVLGSAALELVTGLPYTDKNSDIDLLLKPAKYNRLLQFYRAAQAGFGEFNMDFELELPNGYGVKLAEIFMETQTVLGKSISDVALLNRKDVMQYLQ